MCSIICHTWTAKGSQQNGIFLYKASRAPQSEKKNEVNKLCIDDDKNHVWSQPKLFNVNCWPTFAFPHTKLVIDFKQTNTAETTVKSEKISKRSHSTEFGLNNKNLCSVFDSVRFNFELMWFSVECRRRNLYLVNNTHFYAFMSVRLNIYQFQSLS